MAGLDYVYCPYCGVELETRYIFGDNRRVCPECGFVQFMDPKVAVIGFITSGDRLLLIKRGVEPARGEWALPGGYMDAGEMPRDALSREVQEEVGLTVTAGELLGIFPFAQSSRTAGGIVIAYRVDMPADALPNVKPLDDADAAKWFSMSQLPDQVAFESSQTLINRWRTGQL